MSDEKNSKSTALLGLLPVLILLTFDLFSLYVQPHRHAIPHLAFAVLTAQLLSVLVFRKGEICPGQRGRLSKLQGGFALYWVIWLLLGLFSNYHYVLTDFLCLCGLIITIATYKQPQEDNLRNAMLKIATLSGVISLICYGIILYELPLLAWFQYSPIAQLAIGVVLAHFSLVVARNRLQNFIKLLPLALLLLLLLNAVALLILFMLLQQSAVNFIDVFHNEIALSLYFTLHLVITFIIAVPIFRKTGFNTFGLMIMLWLTCSLPLWANFSYWFHY